MKTLLQMSKMVLVTLFFSSFFAASSLAQSSVYTVNSTDSVLCNGQAYLDSTLQSSSIVWMSGNNTLATGTYSLTNLCNGTYTVSYTDANGNSVTETFTIGSGTTDPCAGFYTYVNAQNPSGPGVCDGSASVTPMGGTAPYVFLWSTGATTSSVNQLCSTFYYCSVEDANGCTTTASIFVTDSTQNPGDSLTIYNDSFPGDTINGDLGTSTTEDCTLDLTNVYYGAITDSYLDSGMVFIVWTLSNSANEPLVTYTLPYPMDTTFYGLYQATLEVYCHGKSTNPYTLTVIDQLLLSSAGITENVLENVQFNNPVNEELSIQMDDASDYDVQVLDLNGKEIVHERVANDNKLTVNTSKMKAGMYILKVAGKNKLFTTKIIK